MQVTLYLNGTTIIDQKNYTTLDSTTIDIPVELLNFESQESFDQSVMDYYNSTNVEIEWTEIGPSVDFATDGEYQEYTNNWSEKSVTVATKI